MIIGIHGLYSTGKSTLANTISEKMGINLINEIEIPDDMRSIFFKMPHDMSKNIILFVLLANATEYIRVTSNHNAIVVDSPFWSHTWVLIELFKSKGWLNKDDSKILLSLNQIIVNTIRPCDINILLICSENELNNRLLDKRRKNTNRLFDIDLTQVQKRYTCFLKKTIEDLIIFDNLKMDTIDLLSIIYEKIYKNKNYSNED